MKVLVTGAAGFIGSHLVDRLVADGHRVTGLDDLSAGRLANLAEARRTKGLSFHKFDVTESNLEDVIAREHPEVVFHLAALRSTDHQREAEVGVLGTANLLHACARSEVQRVVFTSDATAVYAPARRAISERAGVTPGTSFGAGKVAAESFVEAYQRQHGLRGVVLRLGTVYGPRQQRGVVAAFARAMSKGHPATVHGDGSTRRDLVHVDDVVDALLRCVGGKADGRRLNIGSGEATSVRDLHRAMAAIAGVPDAPDYAPSRTGELPSIALDSASARRALGWETTTSLGDGLKDLLGPG
jgi:UDP-glucose 4-epimerase